MDRLAKRLLQDYPHGRNENGSVRRPGCGYWDLVNGILPLMAKQDGPGIFEEVDQQLTRLCKVREPGYKYQPRLLKWLEERRWRSDALPSEGRTGSYNVYPMTKQEEEQRKERVARLQARYDQQELAQRTRKPGPLRYTLKKLQEAR